MGNRSAAGNGIWSSWLALVLISMALPATADTYRLSLEQVEVVRQREASGDRPYIVMIPFQSRFSSRRERPTRTWLIESEPHDWVSKGRYNSALRGRDHMRTGDRLRIPSWMGIAEWQGIEMVDAGGLPYLFGAIIIALDNNNTPPHAVRNLLNQVKDHLQTLLVREIESGRILQGINITDPDAITARLNERVPELANSLVSNLGFDIFDWTFGSTFNPDKLTGIKVYLWPGIRGVRSGSRGGSYTLAGDPLDWHAEWGAPPADSMTLNFVSRGAGAEYRITGRAFLHSRSAASGTSATGPTSRNLEVWLHTGGDDLRANSTVDVTLVPASGASQLFRNVNHGQELRRNSDRTFRLTLPSAWRASDVREVQIRFHSNKRDPLDTGDNWDLLGVRVNLGSTVVLTRQGQPLHRFSGQQPSKSLPVGR